MILSTRASCELASGEAIHGRSFNTLEPVMAATEAVKRHVDEAAARGIRKPVLSQLQEGGVFSVIAELLEEGETIAAMAVQLVGLKRHSWRMRWRGKGTVVVLTNSRLFSVDSAKSDEEFRWEHLSPSSLRIDRRRRSLDVSFAGKTVEWNGLLAPGRKAIFKSVEEWSERDRIEQERNRIEQDRKHDEWRKREEIKDRFRKQERKRRLEAELREEVLQEEGRELPLRPRIPEDVRNAVWVRDQGRCRRCGSRERLELDHIVPVSKGGSNTVRNIELLCERCNRQKGAHI